MAKPSSLHVENCESGLAPQERSTVLPRRRPHHVAEGAAQVGLIGESEIGRDLGQGFAASEGVARPLHA